VKTATCTLQPGACSRWWWKHQNQQWATPWCWVQRESETNFYPEWRWKLPGRWRRTWLLLPAALWTNLASSSPHIPRYPGTHT